MKTQKMKTTSNIEKVKSIFEHVSIETFIKYFEVFKNNKDIRSNADIYKTFESNNEPWDTKSRTTRASKGKAIFRQNLEISALDYIVNFANENRLSSDTIDKAKYLLIQSTHFNIKDEVELLKDIQYIEQSNLINEETKTTMIEVRIGQSNYRSALVNYWKGCSVTNCQTFEILISSHIKSYKDCQNLEEKYDLFNGLLLTPNYDKLFDRFLISFDNQGDILVSKSLSDDDLRILSISKTASIRKDKLIEKHLFYLKQHKAHFEELEITRE